MPLLFRVDSQNFPLDPCNTSFMATMPSNTTTTTVNPHVAVLAFPFSSHAAPLLTVIRGLAALSPNTHFSFLNTPASNTAIFSSYNYKLRKDDDNNVTANIKAYDVWDGVPEGYTLVGKPQEHIELFMKAAPESFKKGMEAAVAETGRKVTCLVTDAFFWFAAEMAEEIGVGWVPFWTAGPNSLSAHVYTDYIRETLGTGGIIGRQDQPLDIPSMSKIQVRDLPEGVVFGNLDSVFSNMLQKMGETLPQAAAVFINSFVELEPAMTNDLQSRFKRFLNIGPFNLISPPPSAPDTNGCIPWLNKQKVRSVAYVSFGSVAALPPHELEALAEALEVSRVPFIWSLKDNFKVNLPKGFLEKTESQGIVVPWAPQLEVLAHSTVGVFVTHCGWNSVLESIGAGVPMICRPFFGDQKLNARMVEDVWEIGVKVKDGVFTKNGAINNLNLIFSEGKGRRARENILALKELARTASRPKGSSIHNFISLSDLVSTPVSAGED